jgi:hypothetical protein
VLGGVERRRDLGPRRQDIEREIECACVQPQSMKKEDGTLSLAMLRGRTPSRREDDGFLRVDSSAEDGGDTVPGDAHGGIWRRGLLAPGQCGVIDLDAEPRDDDQTEWHREQLRRHRDNAKRSLRDYITRRAKRRRWEVTSDPESLIIRFQEESDKLREALEDVVNLAVEVNENSLASPDRAQGHLRGNLDRFNNIVYEAQTALGQMSLQLQLLKSTITDVAASPVIGGLDTYVEAHVDLGGYGQRGEDDLVEGCVAHSLRPSRDLEQRLLASDD